MSFGCAYGFRTMATLLETKELFRRAEAVCFDVDSTVIREEGIDELAKFCGVGDAVTEMCVCAYFKSTPPPLVSPDFLTVTLAKP